MKIKSLRVTRDEPDLLQIKYDLDHNDVVKVDLFRGQRKREQTIPLLQVLKEKAGVTGDLISMCNALLSPKQHHSFFENLPIVNTE